MGIDGKPSRKANYPSFAWVMERYIFPSIALLPGRRLVWMNVPSYDTAPQPVTEGAKVRWKPMTTAKRDERIVEIAHSAAEHEASFDRLLASAVVAACDGQPGRADLLPEDDDALTDISALDLDGYNAF